MTNHYIYIYIYIYISNHCGPCRSVGITTDYGLDDAGSSPSDDQLFRPSRPAVWPHPASFTVCNQVFPGGKVRPERAADHSPPSSVAVMEE